MSDSKTSPNNSAKKAEKRNLPPWMSARENLSKYHGKELADIGTLEESDVGDTRNQAKGSSKGPYNNTISEENESNGRSPASSLSATNFSKLMEGVVFVLSGFVNPERSVLRTQALEMGAEYKPDWNLDCTLLVCAFPNTPKFRQVQADCGTIISKDWISECYNQKKLVDIETYLMHAGKSWRRQNISHEARQDQVPSPSLKSQKQLERGVPSKPTISALSKNGASDIIKHYFSPSKVKKWAIDDLNKTISWLESQEEKPESSQLKNIATEGILTCLQDAIDSLKQEQDIKQMIDQWKFCPRVVEELAKLEGTGNGPILHLKENLYKQAEACKQIYEEELGNFNDVSMVKDKKLKAGGSERDHDGRKIIASDSAAYDSDETVEMTLEETEQAYNIVASSLNNARSSGNKVAKIVL